MKDKLVFFKINLKVQNKNFVERVLFIKTYGEMWGRIVGYPVSNRTGRLRNEYIRNVSRISGATRIKLEVTLVISKVITFLLSTKMYLQRNLSFMKQTN